MVLLPLLGSGRGKADEPAVATVTSGEYRIGLEDTINISVWQHSDMNVNAVVGPDGIISIPLAGEITVKGLTKRELHDLVTLRLKKYIRDPVVVVSILEYGSRRIRVLGQVANPGSYVISGQMTLLEAIARAGGSTATAQLHSCVVFRGTETVIEVDLYKILYEKEPQLNISLQPGDTVFLPDNVNTRVFVLGEVNNPGLYDLGAHLTVLEAIAKAGGYTIEANLGQVFLVRGDLTKPKITKVDVRKQIVKGIIPKTQALQPNDIVFVPKGIVAKLNFVLDQITPSLRAIILGDSAKKAIKGEQTPSITVSP